MNLDNESHLRTFAMALAIARTDASVSYYLTRASIMAFVTATAHLSGWDVVSIVAATLTGSDMFSCAGGMWTLRLLRRAYAHQISRV